MPSRLRLQPAVYIFHYVTTAVALTLTQLALISDTKSQHEALKAMGRPYGVWRGSCKLGDVVVISLYLNTCRQIHAYEEASEMKVGDLPYQYIL